MPSQGVWLICAHLVPPAWCWGNGLGGERERMGGRGAGGQARLLYEKLRCVLVYLFGTPGEKLARQVADRKLVRSSLPLTAAERTAKDELTADLLSPMAAAPSTASSPLARSLRTQAFLWGPLCNWRMESAVGHNDIDCSWRRHMCIVRDGLLKATERNLPTLWIRNALLPWGRQPGSRVG